MSIKFAPGPIQNQRLPSPEETKRSLLATELMREMASDVEPIYSPVHGIAKLGMGALSGYMGARTYRRADEADHGFSADLAKTLGGFGGAPAGASPLSFGGSAASVGPSASSPAGGARAAAVGPTGVSDGFMASLIGTESGGRWDAQNDVSGAGGHKGHFGRLQFGKARLAEAAAAGVIPQGTSPQAFMANPDAQRAVETWHFADIDAQAERRGLTQFVGQTVGGVPITQDGIRAMAHLGGIGGAERFLKSGGRHNPADAYGTSLRDYARKHGGASGPAPEPGPVQVASLDPSIGMPAPQVPQANAALAEAVNPAGAPQVGPQQRELASAVMSYDPASVPQAPAQDPRMVAQLVDPSAGQGAYMDQQRQMIVEMLNSDNPQTRAAGQAMAPQFMDDYRSHQQAMQERAYDAQLAAQRQAYERAQLLEQRGYDAYLRGDERQYDASVTAGERAYEDGVRQQGFQREDARNAYTDGREVVRDARADFESDRSFGHSQAQLVPTSVREYEYGVDNPGFFDQQNAQRRAGATSIDNRQMGTIPPGYRAEYDQEGNVTNLTPIPGGPAAQEAESIAAAGQAADASVERSANVVLEDIGRARSLVEDASWYDPAVGFGAQFMQRFAGSSSTNLDALTETIRANIGFDRLQQMREESPTGGALGNVTERELSNLQAVLGNLSQSQSRDQFMYNLNRLEEVYQGILTKASAYPNATNFGFDPLPQPAESESKTDAPPTGWEDDWQFMTPEEKQKVLGNG